MTPEQIKLIHSAQLDIMRHIHELCVKNNIKYYLVFGAALGAKRHKGYIPWDLDIDIEIPREDYVRFKTVCESQLDCRYAYRDYKNTKNFFAPHALVCLKGSLLTVKRRTLVKRGVNEIFIDVFPLDRAPLDPVLQHNQEKKLKKITLLKAKKCGFIFRGTKSELIAKKITSMLMFWLSFYRIGKMYDDEMRLYEGDKTSNLVCSMASNYSYAKQAMPEDIYGTPTPVSFEGETFFAPEKLDEYLTRLYGDYMTLPPEKDRQVLLDYFEDVSVSENMG